MSALEPNILTAIFCVIYYSVVRYVVVVSLCVLVSLLVVSLDITETAVSSVVKAVKIK